MFTIIIAVYNGASTIKQTIDDLIHHFYVPWLPIEIIVVDDGSTDDTAHILSNYQNHKHVKLLHQANQGVSAARNLGLQHVNPSSEYIIFVDDSDRLSPHFLQQSIQFFSEHEAVNIAVAPIVIEEQGRQRPSMLNHKFDQREDVIDITSQLRAVQFHIGGVVFRRCIFDKGYRFDTALSYWEDALLINQVFIEEGQYGLIRNAFYYYDRNNPQSLSRECWTSADRYIKHIENNYFELIEQSEKYHGCVLPYVQYLIALHYLEYLLEHNQSKLNKHCVTEDPQFIEISEILFRFISVSIIQQLNCPNRYKAFLYELKSLPFPHQTHYQCIQLLIQYIKLKQRQICFSFSDESYGLPVDAKVLITSKTRPSTAQLCRTKCVSMWGVEIEDFSLNLYTAKLSWMQIMFGFEAEIHHEAAHQVITVKSPSVLARGIRRVTKKFKGVNA